MGIAAFAAAHAGDRLG